MDTRYCARCKQDKPLSEWLRNTARRTGFQAYCRECHKAYARDRYANHGGAARVRRRRIAREYGITIEHFDKLVEDQGGRCAICEREADDLHIDHCHDGGQVRALLCGRCNRGIGMFLDDPEALESAAAYLRRHGR